MMKLRFWLSLCVLLTLAQAATSARAANGAANTTYYVSMTDGLDSNNGLSTAAPFKTITKINALNLQPGDHVLFKCGDVWRGEMLMIAHSGASGNQVLVINDGEIVERGFYYQLYIGRFKGQAI